MGEVATARRGRQTLAVDLPLHILFWRTDSNFHHLSGILLELAGLSIPLCLLAEAIDWGTVALLRRHTYRAHIEPVYSRH